MQALPNILPTINGATFQNNGSAEFSTSPHSSEAFDQVMNRALAPTTTTESKTDLRTPANPLVKTPVANASTLANQEAAAATAADFLPQLNTLKTTPQKSSTDHAKETTDVSGHAVVPLPVEIIPPLVNAAAAANVNAGKNIVPTSQATTTLPVTAVAANVAGVVAKTLPTSALPAAKNISATPVKISTPDVAQNVGVPPASLPVATTENIKATGKIFASLPTANVSTPVASENSAPDTTGVVTTILLTPTPSTANDISIAAAKALSSDGSQNVEEPSSNLTSPSDNNTDGIGQVSVLLPEITANLISIASAASVVSTVAETLPVIVAPVSPAAPNQSVGKIISKVVASTPEKSPATSAVVSAVKANATEAVKPNTTDPTSKANATNVVAASGDDDSKNLPLVGKTADDKTTTQFSQPTLFAAPATPNADAKIAAPLQSIVDGTPTANQDGLVGDGVKSNENGVSSGKILPGSGSSAMRGNDLPVRAESLIATATAITATQENPATTTTAAAEPVGNLAVDDLRLQAMERTHELVALHAMRLSDVGTSAVQVVIKPGGGTQLSLELRQRGDGIEAQAVLQQGDFKHLNQHWPELQQRLEQRGIKLAALTDDGITNQNSGNGTGRFEQKSNQSVEAVAGYASAGAVAGTFAPTRTRVITHEGWETWA